MVPNPLNVVVFQECGAWVAHCVEVDICAQANDLKTLERRISMTIQLDLEESISRHGVPFGGIDPAPAHIREKWASIDSNFTSFGSAETDGASPTVIDFRMALAA
jgi:hypothetical protein